MELNMSLNQDFVVDNSIETCEAAVLSIPEDENAMDFFLDPQADFTLTEMILDASNSSIAVESILNNDMLLNGDSDQSKDATSRKPRKVTKQGSPTKVWKCTICSKEFPQNFKLTRHMHIHSEERRYKCSVCGKAFRQMSTLYQHKAIHSAAKPHSCPVCNKSFNRASTLIGHRQIHDGEKSYVCPHCPRAFYQKANLQNHIYTHTKERPYKCEICLKGFNQQSNLTTHKLKVHDPKVVARYLCPVCGKSFAKRANCRKHEEYEHPEQMNIAARSTDNTPSTSTDNTTDSMSNKSTDNATNNSANKATDDTTNNSIDNTTDNTTDKSTSSSIHGTIPQLPPGTISVPIDPIDTEGVRIARANNQPLLVLLQPLEGSPVMVRIHETGDGRQMLVPILWTELCRYSQIINMREFEGDEGNTTATEKFKLQINVPIVASMQECQIIDEMLE